MKIALLPIEAKLETRSNSGGRIIQDETLSPIGFSRVFKIFFDFVYKNQKKKNIIFHPLTTAHSTYSLDR